VISGGKQWLNWLAHGGWVVVRWLSLSLCGDHNYPSCVRFGFCICACVCDRTSREPKYSGCSGSDFYMRERHLEHFTLMCDIINSSRERLPPGCRLVFCVYGPCSGSWGSTDAHKFSEYGINALFFHSRILLLNKRLCRGTIFHWGRSYCGDRDKHLGGAAPLRPMSRAHTGGFLWILIECTELLFAQWFALAAPFEAPRRVSPPFLECKIYMRGTNLRAAEFTYLLAMHKPLKFKNKVWK